MSYINANKGEVLMDNRDSGMGLNEFWTFTCPHCNVVRYVNPFSGNIVRLRVITKMPEGIVESFSWREVDPPIMCRKCMAYMCDNPICHTECLPVARGIDLTLAKDMENVNLFNTDDKSRYLLKQAYDNDKTYLGVSLGENK